MPEARVLVDRLRAGADHQLTKTSDVSDGFKDRLVLAFVRTHRRVGFLIRRTEWSAASGSGQRREL
jgi:hypothetical protein